MLSTILNVRDYKVYDKAQEMLALHCDLFEKDGESNGKKREEK